jgi:hypothetical protein
MSHRPPYAAPDGGQDAPPYAVQSGGQVARPPLPVRVVSSAPVLLSCCLPPACLALSAHPLLPCCPPSTRLPCIIHRPLLLCCPPPAIPCAHPHTLLPQSTIQSCRHERDNIATIIVAATSPCSLPTHRLPLPIAGYAQYPQSCLPPLLATASLLSIATILYHSHYTYMPTVATRHHRRHCLNLIVASAVCVRLSLPLTPQHSLVIVNHCHHRAPPPSSNAPTQRRCQ